MNYVGMDYHKRYSVVCILDDARNIMAQQRIEHAFPERSVQLLGAHALCQEAFEASMNWGLLYEILEVIPGFGRRAMANPLYVRLIAAAQVKTDKVDARKRTQLLRAGLLPSSHIPDRARRMRKEVLRIRTFWVRECTKVRNRIHRLLGRQHGLALPQVSDLFGKKGRSALSKLALPAPDDLPLRQQVEMLDGLDKHIHELDKKIALEGTNDVAVGCDAYFGGLYRHHRARGKKANTAILMIARRMCQIIFRVLREKRAYQARPWNPKVPGCSHVGRTERVA